MIYNCGYTLIQKEKKNKKEKERKETKVKKEKEKEEKKEHKRNEENRRNRIRQGDSVDASVGLLLGLVLTTTKKLITDILFSIWSNYFKH